MMGQHGSLHLSYLGLPTATERGDLLLGGSQVPLLTHHPQASPP